MEIWLNPACSKCRTAAAALDEAGVTYTVRRYLDELPSADDLGAVVDRLGLEPWDVARAKEVREAGISLPKDAAHRREWLEAMVAHPRTIQRPLITADDGTRVEVTGGSRAAQKRAFDALGAGLGEQWVSWVDGQGAVWERLRRDYLERPWDPALAHRDAVRLLRSRTSLHSSVRRAFSDPRLRLVGGHPAAEDGHDPRRAPAWLGTVAYVEQKFGAWTVPDGLGRLAEVLTARLATRRVDVRTGTEVTDLVLRGDRVVAVRTGDGELEADAVVCAVDPHRLPSLAPYVRRTRSTTPPHVTHLGILDDGTPWPGALVLHDPDRRDGGSVVVRAGGRAPEGRRSLTVSHRLGDVDTVAELARRGLDLRDRVTVRVDRSSAELTDAWGGSPLGVQWQGRSTTARRLGPRTPVAGLYAAGSHATPGSGIPFAGLTGSLVAQAIGPA